MSPDSPGPGASPSAESAAATPSGSLMSRQSRRWSRPSSCCGSLTPLLSSHALEDRARARGLGCQFVKLRNPVVPFDQRRDRPGPAQGRLVERPNLVAYGMIMVIDQELPVLAVPRQMDLEDPLPRYRRQVVEGIETV